LVTVQRPGTTGSTDLPLPTVESAAEVIVAVMFGEATVNGSIARLKSSVMGATPDPTLCS
jgi:hypothetical protein